MRNIFNKKTITRSFVFVSCVLFPSVVFAQGGATEITQGFSTVAGVVNSFNSTVVRAVATLFLSTAVVIFFFGIVKYIWGKQNGDAKAVGAGGNFMVWGLVALFVMFSVWGIITYAQRIFGIEGRTNINIPQVEFNKGNTTNTNNQQYTFPPLPVQ